jgi:hypothetical protein
LFRLNRHAKGIDMAKRNKSAAQPALPEQPAPTVAHPPTKNPTLLAVSIVLFGLWFVFLLVAAVWH